MLLIQGEDRGMSRGQSGGVVRWFAHPLGGVEFRGHTQYPAFALDTLFLLQALQKRQLGFFCLLVSFVQNLPLLPRCAVVFSPIEFLCTLLMRRGVSKCIAAKGLTGLTVNTLI